MRRPVRVMDADTPQRRGRSVHLPVPHGPTAWKSPMVVVEPDSTVSRSRGSVMLRPFYETLGEETPSGERPPPRSQPDQHDQALCELARGGRRQVHADPTRLEVLALSSSSRNPEPTPPMDHPNRLVGGSADSSGRRNGGALRVQIVTAASSPRASSSRGFPRPSIQFRRNLDQAT